MSENQKTSDWITNQSIESLNKNGYSFQYSVISELMKISQQWRFYGSEIPVSTRGKNIHADLIFHNAENNSFIVGECKRVYQKFGDWFFVKTPFNFRKTNYQTPCVFDRLRESRDGSLPETKKTVSSFTENMSADIYGIGFIVKSQDLPQNAKENNSADQKNRDVINETVTQVLRATSGFINHLAQIVQPSNLVKYNFEYNFLPVVFTTAKLWVSDTNIAEADLSTGNLATLAEVREVPYVWYNYNRPRELSPEFKEFIYYYNQPFAAQTQRPTDTFIKEADKYGQSGFEFEDYTRSVLIINSSNLNKLDSFIDL